MDLRQLVRAYVPSSAAGRTLVVVTVTDAIGTGLYLSGSVLYFVRGVGLSGTNVGTGLTVAGLAGFLATVPLGMLGDRVGAKRMLVALQLWRAAMLVLLSFVTNFPGFVVAAIGVTVAARSVPPATQAVVAAVMSERDRVSTMAVMRSVRNVGYSVGAALTVPIFAVDSLWSYRLIMLGNATTFVVSVLLLAPLRTSPAAPGALAARSRYPAGFRDWRFLGLALVNGLLYLHASILSIAIPLWALATGAPRWLVSVLFMLNTGLAVLLQVASARGADRPGFGERALRRAALALVTCCLIFASAPLGDRYVVVAALTAGAIALTAGELWQSAGGWELSFHYSPPARRAEYLSAFNLGPAAQDIAGPLLMTTAVSYRSTGWLVMALLFALVAALVRPAVNGVSRRTVLQPAIEDR